MNVINKELFKNAKGGTAFDGVCLIKGYSKKQTKTGKDYIEGSLQSGSEIRFNAWSSSEALNKLVAEDYVNMPCRVIGTFDEFKGNVSATLVDVVAVTGFVMADFLEARVDADAYLDALKALSFSRLSESGKTLLSKMLFDNTDLVNRFKVEFAAKTYHGNYLSGLLVHTFRMESVLSWILSTYSNLSSEYVDGKLVKSEKRVDLLYIGVVLHDIGKVQELEYGVYTKSSAVTHRILGLDLLYQFRMDIEGLYDEKWFRDLQSIIVEHHGEYEESCRTVPAYIVHKIDMLESAMEGLNSRVGEDVVVDTAGERVLIETKFLAI